MNTSGHHSHPRLFDLPGSPLHGRWKPADWHTLDFPGKCQALVRTALARDFRHAAGLLGKHVAAARKRRCRQTPPEPTGRKTRLAKWWDR